MKKLIYILLFPLMLFSQENNFTINDNNLVWQKIYNDTVSINNLLSSLKLSGKFKRIEIINNIIEFENNFSGDDLKHHGYKKWSDAIFLGEPTDCTGSIEFKDNRYRVTVFQMIATSPVDYSKTPVYEFLVKKNAFRTGNMFIKARKYYDNYFTELFKYKGHKSEW